MDNFLNNGPVESLEFLVRPVNSCLWFRNSLEVFFPRTDLGMKTMVHHEDTKDVELCILRGIVVEEIIVVLEEFE